MKRQIRRGVFETNSSSTHSLTMMLKEDYDNWCEGDLFLFDGYSAWYPEDNQPLENYLYTKEEAITFEKLSKWAPSEDFDWNDDDAVMTMLRENNWTDYDSWCSRSEYYETYEQSMITPKGDHVVAFGFYGHDC